MAVTSPLGRRPTVAFLLTLTVVTGLVDAVSYLRLGRVFVANMTGNFVFLGFSIERHSGVSPITSIIAIIGFMGGALVGGRVAAQLDSDPRRWLGVSIGAEAVILGFVAACTATGVLPFTGSNRYITVVVMAFALGIQNSTVRHFGVPDLTTTVLSLTLTALVSETTLVGGSGARPVRRLGSILAMVGGAAAGAGLFEVTVSGVVALAAVLAGLVALGFMTLGKRAESAIIAP